MKDIKKFVTQLDAFIQWFEDLCKDEQIDTAFLDRYKASSGMVKKVAWGADFLPAAVQERVWRVARSAFLESRSGAVVGVSMENMSFDDFMTRLVEAKRMIDRLLSGNVTMLNSGREVTEAERMYNNLRWLSMVVQQEFVESLPADITATDERKAEAVQAFNHIELQQQRVISAAVDGTIREQQALEKNLPPRQLKRRHPQRSRESKPPASLLLRSDSTTSLDQEPECSESISETSSTSEEYYSDC